MRDYEAALIRLKAFKLLKGWGTTVIEKGKEKFIPNTLERRMELADDLADWAMQSDEDGGGDGESEEDKEESNPILRLVGKSS